MTSRSRATVLSARASASAVAAEAHLARRIGRYPYFAPVGGPSAARSMIAGELTGPTCTGTRADQVVRACRAAILRLRRRHAFRSSPQRPIDTRGTFSYLPGGGPPEGRVWSTITESLR